MSGMEYIVEEKFPYIIMGGLPIPNSVSNFDEAKFYEKMKEAIGSDNFRENEQAIRAHLEKPNAFIEFGDFIFRRG